MRGTALHWIWCTSHVPSLSVNEARAVNKSCQMLQSCCLSLFAHSRITFKMDNTDLIARVYAVPHDQRRAWKAIKASSRYVAPAYSDDEDDVEYGRHDRAGTEP